MLTPEFIDKAPNEISKIYLEMENWTLQDIARRISQSGKLTSTAQYQLARISESREFDKEFRTRLSELTGKTEIELEKIFKEATEMAYTYDKRLFDIKGIPFIPFEENIVLQRLTAISVAQTNDLLQNLTRTSILNMLDPITKKPIPIPQFFIRTLDNITMQVATGVTSYDEATKRAINSMVDNGITVVNYENGRNERIEGVVRRNLVTAIGQMADKVTWNNIEQLGAEHVIVSMHDGARTGEGTANHQAWQGKVYALNGFRLEL